MAIRKNASQLSASEINTLVAAFKELKRRGRYDLYVLQHAQANMSNIHRCPAFLPWHRQLLWELEKEMQEIANDPDLALPYWHWGENAEHENPEHYPMWADNFLGPGGRQEDNYVVKTGPFREWEWEIVDMSGNPAGPLVRSLGESPIASDLPTREQIEAMLRVMPFDVAPFSRYSTSGYRNLLEGWYGSSQPMFHNRGHVWVGGSMIPMTSPNDPVFFLHHCFVDKLWWDWQQRHGAMGMAEYLPESGGRRGQNLNDQMDPAMTGSMSPADLLDIEALGYSYDAPEPAIDTNVSFSTEGNEGTGHEGHGGHGGHEGHGGGTSGGGTTGGEHTGGGSTEGGGHTEGGHDGHSGGGENTGDGGSGGGHTGSGGGGGNTGGGTTGGTSSGGGASGGRARGKGCMVTLVLLLSMLFFFTCKPGQGMSKMIGFELYEQKEIVPSAYWYFDISPGAKDVYKVMTAKEDIYFEVPGGQKTFSIGSAQMEAAKVKIITKDNQCFLGNSGAIKGELKGEALELELAFESLTAKSNVQGEFIVKGKSEKEKHQINVKGVVKRVKK